MIWYRNLYTTTCLLVACSLLFTYRPDEVEYEESLPQQLVFEHELLPRSPSPEQLPIPSHSQDCNSNYNNCQDYDTNSLDEKDPIGEDDKSVKDEAALAYRRDSLQTSQDSRKRLRDLHKQASLTKLRQSMTEDIPAVPSDPPIQEEMWVKMNVWS